MTTAQNRRVALQISEEARITVTGEDTKVPNYEIEILRGSLRPKEGEENVRTWHSMGFASSLRSALSITIHREFLVPTSNDYKNVQEAVKAIEASNALVEKAIQSLKSGGNV